MHLVAFICVQACMHTHASNLFQFAIRGEWDMKPHSPLSKLCFSVSWGVKRSRVEWRGGECSCLICNQSLRYQSLQGRQAVPKSGHYVVSVISFWVGTLGTPSPSTCWPIWTPPRKDVPWKRPSLVWLLSSSVNGYLCRELTTLMLH